MGNKLVTGDSGKMQQKRQKRERQLVCSSTHRVRDSAAHRQRCVSVGSGSDISTAAEAAEAGEAACMQQHASVAGFGGVGGTSAEACISWQRKPQGQKRDRRLHLASAWLL